MSQGLPLTSNHAPPKPPRRGVWVVVVLALLVAAGALTVLLVGKCPPVPTPARQPAITDGDGSKKEQLP